ncbi:DNA translocase FtsK [Beijerinckiaceae bacterium RH AL1]|nr:DNA translocase FtsK [Beijerinckiaceae bacterium]VVB50022.1 DNA translocase FtsK [Beijerinckiaceae bacterium RH CH11]VVB50103.1 DNA translocase FtsK [Beijerinckiaceae bacterium RH AL8]VVC57198.1 DNA translocase FtsK [Beijerinckiaceae bacterium RH AL1]
MRTTTSASAFDHIPESVRLFFARRCAEACGAAMLVGLAALAIALMTWSVQDPSFNHATAAPVHNWLRGPGAVTSDLVMQLFGLSAIAIMMPLAFWGWTLVTTRRLARVGMRIALLFLGALCAAGVAALLPVSAHWPLPSGLGGVVGDVVMALPRRLLGGVRPALVVLALVMAIGAVLLLSASVGVRERTHLDDDDAFEDAPARLRLDRTAEDDEDGDGEPGLGLLSLGAAIHAGLSLKGLLTRGLRRFAARRAPTEDDELPPPPPWASRDFEPPLDMPAGDAVASQEQSRFDARAYAPPSLRAAAERDAGAGAPTAPPAQTRVIPAAPSPTVGQRALREINRPEKVGAYVLPPLAMLAEAKRQQGAQISEDALQQNARLLEGVLDDFGVKGEIINVRPGPVVTLYELEPAPGIKSSRVIGLADDIARSMSAISARVAVVPGRNAIGIELPNQRRETVFLRELLASQDFDKTKHSLAIALGKNIGGEPIIVDLAKMPHLLVAGTTGSGKSVAINTMILSLLYRLKPAQCRLIMVDPKMLELSVYDGIPHLLTPVVTDPKKAVVALKWAVREMEDRYKKMSKVSVRNIDGFNARVAEAAAKGEQLTRTVQTGYDRETGEAIYEHEAMELQPLPYIVVIVDEMADLMMVAGKDIEGAIQRLAQMARAAGIHLIMATQRPSVDVITGTIKANFPTRISFQVTSKIDSRTILGEMGAEQLLGQGDMLHMAGGGRISRVHGPFVSDGEVEKVVAHLKSQGQPDYLDAITSEDEASDEDAEAPAAGSMDAEESGDLYDRAVAIVLRDRKCSVSYIQRRLSVGYNKAASLVERMEREGVVGAPNHSGKRTILVGGGSDHHAFELQGSDD